MREGGSVMIREKRERGTVVAIGWWFGDDGCGVGRTVVVMVEVL